MSKLIQETFGKLTKCIDVTTQQPYTYNDWRTGYLNKVGYIMIIESEQAYPGKTYAYLFPYDNYYDYLRTSCGDIEYYNNSCKITTDHSIYEFEFGDFNLSESDKQELYLKMFYYFLYNS